MSDEIDQLEKEARENLDKIITSVRKTAELSILITKAIGDIIDREFSRLLRESLDQIEKEIAEVNK